MLQTWEDKGWTRQRKLLDWRFQKTYTFFNLCMNLIKHSRKVLIPLWCTTLNHRCGFIPSVHVSLFIFSIPLQRSAAQLFWIWSAPGLILDTAATILSPQLDPKACQSYKLGFREVEDDQQQERRRTLGMWQLCVKRGSEDGRREREEGAKKMRWWQLKRHRPCFRYKACLHLT